MLVYNGKYTTEDKLQIQMIKKLNTNPEKANNAKKQQNKTTLVQLLLRTLGQETTWAYSTMLSSPHGV